MVVIFGIIENWGNKVCSNLLKSGTLVVDAHYFLEHLDYLKVGNKPATVIAGSIVSPIFINLPQMNLKCIVL
nr:hypothetical protein [Zobellia laminariae]